MKGTLGFLAVVAILAAFSAPVAKADTIDFSGVGNGTFSWTQGAGNPLTITGNSGSLTTITDVDTGAAAGFTGSYNLVSAGCASGCTGSAPNFGAGGSLTITDVSGGPAGIAPGAALLTGTFLSASGSFFSTAGTFSGILNGTINSTLLAYFCPSCVGTSGVGSNVQSLFKVSFNSGTGTYSGNLSSSDISITPVSPVPEPSTVVLLGGGLLLMLLVFFRRLPVSLLQFGGSPKL